MKQTVTESMFRDSFRNRPENFSHAGLGALYNYLEELEAETGEEIELDPIALCCDFAEYANLAELQGDYADIDDMQDLEDQTTVIPLGDDPATDGFIVQVF